MFKPVTLEWKGRPVVIPANRLLGAIAAVEEAVTFNELIEFSKRRAYPTARVAAAFGILLRYAGEDVTDEQIYAGLFGDPAVTMDAAAAIQLLMMMMVPPHLRNGKVEAPVLAPGEVAPGKRKAASKSNSSRRTMMPSSGKGGARR
jgi:hypothetical protein